VNIQLLFGVFSSLLRRRRVAATTICGILRRGFSEHLTHVLNPKMGTVIHQSFSAPNRRRSIGRLHIWRGNRFETCGLSSCAPCEGNLVRGPASDLLPLTDKCRSGHISRDYAALNVVWLRHKSRT
jgi:hypothetical protein